MGNTNDKAAITVSTDSCIYTNTGVRKLYDSKHKNILIDGPDGFKPFMVENIRDVTDMYQIEFDDGSIICVAPNTYFIDLDEQYINVSELKIHSKIRPAIIDVKNDTHSTSSDDSASSGEEFGSFRKNTIRRSFRPNSISPIHYIESNKLNVDNFCTGWKSLYPSTNIYDNVKSLRELQILLKSIGKWSRIENDGMYGLAESNQYDCLTINSIYTVKKEMCDIVPLFDEPMKLFINNVVIIYKKCL